MPPKQPPEPKPMTILEQLEIIQWAMRFPALSVMVFLRQDIGYRMLNPIALIGIAFVMLVFAGLFRPESRPEDLWIFTAVMLALGFGQRLARWRQIGHGVNKHSYSLGTSCFESAGIPEFLRRNGRANFFLDPACCIIAGFILLHFSRALGAWLIISGLCLRFYEYAIFRKEMHQVLDIGDSLITSTVQSEIVEHFEKPSSARPAQQSQGIPTGLGSDIEQHIEQRKRNPPP
jgi:hypothetical protein